MTLLELLQSKKNLPSARTGWANVRLERQQSPKNHHISLAITLSPPTQRLHERGTRYILTAQPSQRVPMNLHTEGGIVQRAVIANSDRP